MSELGPATLRRYQERGLYDIKSAKKVFDDSFIAHVSYVDDGFPACQPMLALIREEWVDPEGEEQKNELIVDGTSEEEGKGREKTAYVYLHGHPTTRLMELIKRANKAAEAEAEAATAQTNGHATNGHASAEPVKVCITATKGKLILFFLVFLLLSFFFFSLTAFLFNLVLFFPSRILALF